MVRRMVAAGLLLVGLTACSSGPPEPDLRTVLQSQCMAKGGAYFEYESTSAGSHVWCVREDGAQIHLDGSGNEHP